MAQLTDQPDKEEILLLADLVCSGGAKEQDYARLNVLLNGNYQNTQIYISYLDTHARLGLLGTDLYPQTAVKYLKKHTPPVIVDYRVAYYILSLSLLIFCMLGIGIYTYVNTHDAVAVIRERQIEGIKASHWSYKSAVNRNTTYQFEEGLITLDFIRNTQVTLKGPCKFIPRGPQSIELITGELAAYVHDPDVQLRVLTKEMNIVDMGTGFGVKVGEKALEVHVFSGKVAVAPIDLANNKLNILETDNAINLDKKNNTISYIASKPLEFSSWQHQLREVFIHSTGLQLKPGEQDKAWFAKNTQSGEIFSTYTLKTMSANYDMNPYNHSFWISSHPQKSLSPDDENYLPNNAEFVYYTEFNLENVDIHTMTLDLTYWADNQVTAIRLNDKLINLPVLDYRQFASPNSLIIGDHFVVGKNTLEFVVKNGESKGEQVDASTRSAMAFRAEIKARVHDKIP